ncbi:hypothetical protein [Jiangella anatolica]|uniref:Lipoprotein n=1 Tax=Jiangella anatolica TaxID=2670374 RepID=A0A2W2C337_9ACTN|nr:hypothetical protein [Jiangella anatolica]PZF86478.1 hypothetical protein C1I92_01320 [Jiangella anatolica]
MKRLAAIAAVLMLVAACADEPPRLSEWDAGSARGIFDTRPGQPYAFEEMTLCLDEPGSAVITDVAPIEPAGGFEVLDFSVQPPNQGDSRNYLAEPTERLAAGGYPADGPMVVDGVCPDDRTGEGGTAFNLGIEVAYSAPDAGTARGFRVTYESGGESLTVVRPFAISLCTAPMGEAEPVTPPECEVEIVESG